MKKLINAALVAMTCALLAPWNHGQADDRQVAMLEGGESSPAPCCASSDAQQQSTLTAAELMGRLVVNEETWNLRGAAAIAHIRVRSARSRQQPLAEHLLALHGRRSLRPDRATNVAPDDNRPWIGDLSADMHEPRGWRERGLPDWETWGKVKWASVLRVVQGVIDGTVGDPCRAGWVTPNTWGDRRRDRERALRNQWEPAVCGETANDYWRQ